jgi:transketolase N-terminal domain/subunit
MKKTPGIDATRVPGERPVHRLGMAAAAKNSGKNYRTFVIAGTGSSRRGSCGRP